MNDSAGALALIGNCALTMEEYFRDEERRDVLLLV
ncbi:MAG: F0F1-type ATP synthase beta subunit [Lentimonas sp.]|jgi:F0F1-type ATP synthase beta subunit